MQNKIRFTGWGINGEINYETVEVVETDLFYHFVEDEEMVLREKEKCFLFDSVFEMAESLKISNNLLRWKNPVKEKRLMHLNNLLDKK